MARHQGTEREKKTLGSRDPGGFQYVVPDSGEAGESDPYFTKEKF